MDKLFDESILIGSGYTARETLRYAAKLMLSGQLSVRGSDSWHLVSGAFYTLAVGPSFPLDLELQDFF